MAYKSKFKGKEIDDKLDLVQELSKDISDIKEYIKNIPQEETDPVFSNSPAAGITENDKEAWDNKVDAEDIKDIKPLIVDFSISDILVYIHYGTEFNYNSSSIINALQNKQPIYIPYENDGLEGYYPVYGFIDDLIYLDVFFGNTVYKLELDLSGSGIVSIDERNSDNFVSESDLANIALTGDYNDLMNKPTIPAEQVNADWNATSGKAHILNKPTIPSAVTESTVSGWGFTKNTGTYSKPSTGIPKSDLASSVQASLEKADKALQSYTEQYRGTVTGVKINGSTKNPSNGVVDLGNVITEHQDIAGIEGEVTANKLAQKLSTPSEDNTNPLATAQDLESKTDIVASQIFLELHTDLDAFQVFSHKIGYEEHNRTVCQRLIENCFTDKAPNNEMFFVTINGSRDGVPYMETAILESRAEELVCASFVKSNVVDGSLSTASIGFLSIDAGILREYVESGEDIFYWRYISIQDESDVYVTEFTFENITTNGTTVNVSPELVNAIYNKRIIVIPGRSGNYIATNTFSAPPYFSVNIRMQIATGVYIYDVILSAKESAPQNVRANVNSANLLYGTLSTINGASIARGGDMQLVSSISLNGKTYIPSKGAVDLGNIEGAQQADFDETDVESKAYIKNRSHYFQSYVSGQQLVANDTTVGTNIAPITDYFKLGGSVYKSADMVGVEFNCQKSGAPVFVTVVKELDSDGNPSFYLRHISGNSSSEDHIMFSPAGTVKTIDSVFIPENFATKGYVETAIAEAITSVINASY